MFTSWLEYLPTKNATFWISCNLVSTKSTKVPDQYHSLLKDFNNWKKFNEGKNPAFLGHAGKCPNIPHNIVEPARNNLTNKPQHMK